MATITSTTTAASFSCMGLVVVVMCVCVGSVVSKESTEISQSDIAGSSHHQTQKRSAALLDSAYPGVDMDQDFADSSSLLDNPYDDELVNKRTLFRFGKRGSIFRFGKRARGSLLRFGKRGGSLLRFGKRGGSLLRFGRSGAQNMDDSEAEKRNSLFRFGKRADDSDSLMKALEGYYAVPSYTLSDDVDSKRNVNSFHWGESEK